MKRLKYENNSFDRIDGKLLLALAEDGRATVSDLAKHVGLSPPTVSERIRRLEEVGAIEGYQAKINAAAIGLSLSAWLRIRPVPGELKRVTEILKECPEIVECDRVTGDDCFVAKAHVMSVGDLEILIDRLIPYAMTNTAIIQSSPVTRRAPDLTHILTQA